MPQKFAEGNILFEIKEFSINKHQNVIFIYHDTGLIDNSALEIANKDIDIKSGDNSKSM